MKHPLLKWIKIVTFGSCLGGVPMVAAAWVPPAYSHHQASAALWRFQSCLQHRFLSSSALCAKKAKLSMAEKRKRRAKRLPPRPVTGRPVDFSKTAPETNAAAASPAEPPQERAKQLLEAQRKSVNMLTHVRECVEALPVDDIRQSLSTRGYFVLDNFLGNEDIVSELEKEGIGMLREDRMEADLENLGYGEYVMSIKGGEEQYAHCPRLVELVVSVTKHLPPLLDKNLDASACMATLRTYDRNSHLASLQLLKEEESDEASLPKRPFGVISKDAEDRRKVSLKYYPIDNKWTGDILTLEYGEENVGAVRDRLVLLASDSCSHRRNPWPSGQEDLDVASCVELHFVQKT